MNKIFTESICKENPQGCSFQIVHYSEGRQLSGIDLEQHLLLFAKADISVSKATSLKMSFYVLVRYCLSLVAVIIMVWH